jgi:hypothetical protein
MEREPRVAERMHDVMRQRLGGESITPKGDLVTEELEAEAKLDKPEK